jgi:hypothetical protein
MSRAENNVNTDDIVRYTENQLMIQLIGSLLFQI